ncbi:MAG: hypothetical protein K9H14_06560, partial [Actinomycetia bacterium]|nr:hypothetical protein [Actinomycetes bacterium]
MAEEEKKSGSGNGEDVEAKEEFSGAREKNEQEDQEEVLRKLQEEIDKLGTKDILTQMMMSLSSLAYKKMGLPAGTNDRFKNQEDAKLAVDAFDSLLKVVNDELSAEE